MKKIIYTLFMLAASSQIQGQVGIGTNTPDNSAMLEVQSNERGILFPRMTSAQRNGIASPANGLHVFDTNTNSLWYFNGTVWINTVSDASLGDVKSGFQPNDHSGWILMDGRAINTLTPNQQAAAIALGFTTNLPDASSAYLVQNNGTMGAVSGANTTTLTQANLPNVTFNGTAASAGAHSHNVDPAPINTSIEGNHTHTTNGFNVNTTTDGAHTHGTNSNSNVGFAFRNCNETTTALDNGQCNELNLVTIIQLIINSAGNHSHTVSIPTTTSNSAGAHNHTVDIPVTTSTTDGAHTHTVTVSSGGSANPINIAPRSLTVNMFVYLGL